MKRTKRLVILGLLFALVISLINCDESDESATTPPASSPDFIGDILQVEPLGQTGVLGTILVEGEDVIRSSDKYVITITEETHISIGEDGGLSSASFDALEAGQQVSIWFSGPVKESYPAQVDAARIVIADGDIENEFDLGDEFPLAVGQGARIAGEDLTILFVGVTGESRCPQDVVCIRAGEVFAEIEITDADGSRSLTLTYPGLTSSYAVTAYEGYEISFRVTPQPVSDASISDDDYRLWLKIIRADFEQMGALKGQVTIGPIQPVVRPGDDPMDVPPEVYEARKVMIYDESADHLIRQVDIGNDGHYSVELASGIYVVDINHIGIDSSSDVPRAIDIAPGQTITLDIDIDTGIR